VPGLPKLPFLVIGLGVTVLGARLPKELPVEEAESEPAPAAPAPDSPEALAASLGVEPLALELGLELIDLVQPERGGDLLDRVKSLRRNVAMELGIVMPQVHTRDNLDLSSSAYAIKVHDVEVARGEAPRGKLLAIGPNIDQLSGVDTRDPAFGGRAKWIAAELSHQAAVAGVTVVDRSAVVTTHLAEVVREHAGALLSRQDTKLLLDVVKNTNPVVLEEMTAAGLTLGDVQGVLRALLDEGVPVRDLVRIVEALTEQARTGQKDPDGLLEAARITLGSTIGSLYAPEGTLPVITLAPPLEHHLLGALQSGDRGRTLGITAPSAESLVRQLAKLSRDAESRGEVPVVMCSTRLRPALRRLLRPSLPRLAVVGAGEIGASMPVETIGSVNDEAVALN